MTPLDRHSATDVWRTPGGIEYSAPPESIDLFQEVQGGSPLSGEALARVVVRLEHLLEQTEGERDEGWSAYRAAISQVQFQERRIAAADAKIDELAFPPKEGEDS